MKILGISAFYHDSAAALVCDGQIVAAAQQERFSREKADEGFPKEAILYCLDEAGIDFRQVDRVAFYDKPFLTFDRLLETYISFAPRGITSFIRAIPVWVKQKLLQKRLILDGINGLGRGDITEEKIAFSYHHHSHAASAFYPSPFENAAVMIMDGVGEWATTSLGEGRGTNLQLAKEIRFPHSIGMLYSAFTYYLGFKVNEGEYKVMGLAPYGEPKFADTILEHLLDLKSDGSFRLDQEYFNYCTGLTMTNRRFDQLFGGPPRQPGEPLTQRHMDLARSVQAVTEEVVLRISRTLHAETGHSNLCLAGGVALNCVANGRVLREGPFKRIWIQPASGDAGGAIGAALAVAVALGDPRPTALHGDGMSGAYLGPAFNQEQIRTALRGMGASFVELPEEALAARVAQLLAEEKVVGWFQGRMEFGPRALGNRSILGDARSPRMQRVLNMKIKYRESFRPFAPAVLHEEASAYFDIDADSPYMLLVAPVKKERRRELTAGEEGLQGLARLNVSRSDIPAVTHVDGTARIQSVHAETNPRFHRLLCSFRAITGYGILVNTSFNVRDEPIVCTPEDAYRCFMGTEMDALAIGDALLLKDSV